MALNTLNSGTLEQLALNGLKIVLCVLPSSCGRDLSVNWYGYS